MCQRYMPMRRPSSNTHPKCNWTARILQATRPHVQRIDGFLWDSRALLYLPSLRRVLSQGSRHSLTLSSLINARLFSLSPSSTYSQPTLLYVPLSQSLYLSALHQPNLPSSANQSLFKLLLKYPYLWNELSGSDQEVEADFKAQFDAFDRWHPLMEHNLGLWISSLGPLLTQWDTDKALIHEQDHSVMTRPTR